MAIASIILGVAALLFMIFGFVFTVVPFLGTVLSFLAPLLAIAGIVTGGLGISRAKRSGDSSGAATAGLVVNIVVLIPALLVAVTCGLCNACATVGMMNAPADAGPNPWGLPTQPSGPNDPSFQPQPGTEPLPEPAVDPNAPPNPSELASFVDDLNELCPDTMCEGEYDYRFQTLTCDGGKCRLAFEARHYRNDPDYRSAEVELPTVDRPLECVSTVTRGGQDVCVERGGSEALWDAVVEALGEWERQQR